MRFYQFVILLSIAALLRQFFFGSTVTWKRRSETAITRFRDVLTSHAENQSLEDRNFSEGDSMIWHPTDEWIHSCIQQVENEISRQSYDNPWVGYHLEDCIQDCIGCKNSILSSKFGSLSIAGKYWINLCRKGKRNITKGAIIHYTLKLFEEYKRNPFPYLEPWGVPSDDELVIQMSIGNATAEGNVTPFELLRYGTSVVNRVDGVYDGDVKSINEYLALIEKLGPRKVVLLMDINRWNRPYKIYARCLVTALESSGLLTAGSQFVGSRNPDQDFFFMSHAKHFVSATSDYSQVVSSMVEHLGGKSIHLNNDVVVTSHENLRDDVHNYLLYITTIFSSSHQQFFRYCWPNLLQKSKLLQEAHVVIFSNNVTEVNASIISFVGDLFSKNPSFRLEFAVGPTLYDMEKPSRRFSWMAENNRNRFQFGANEAVRLGFANSWFLDFSWIIRINPDVLIRRSSWILETMNDPSVDGIFIECSRHPIKIHTDFFAVRPLACHFDAFEEMVEAKEGIGNHEMTAAKEFKHIISANRHRWLPDNEPSRSICRVRGNQSSIIHAHYSIGRDEGGGMFCRSLKNFDID